jgi:hypothetical protein
MSQQVLALYDLAQQIGILSWWTRLANLFGRNQTRRGGKRFGRLSPRIERINGVALVVEYF